MDFLEPAKKQSGKERARKSRQRKKKYYDDLESLNQHLQKQVDKLTKEVEYYKQRLKTLEWNNEPTSVQKCQEFEDFFVNNVVDEIKKIPRLYATFLEKHARIAEQKLWKRKLTNHTERMYSDFR